MGGGGGVTVSPRKIASSLRLNKPTSASALLGRSATKAVASAPKAAFGAKPMPGGERKTQLDESQM